MPDHPLLAEKLRSGAHVLLALLLVLFGVRGGGTPLAIVGLPIVVLGVVCASQSFGRLVRLHNQKFHPDRHQHFGEAAAKEAPGRFREVQQAYEPLLGRA